MCIHLIQQVFFSSLGINITISSYILTEAGKNYLGSDGTEIGIHGGSQPFTDVPSTPQTSHFAFLNNNLTPSVFFKVNI
mgnify:CR=1 FL=1